MRHQRSYVRNGNHAAGRFRGPPRLIMDWPTAPSRGGRSPDQCRGPTRRREDLSHLAFCVGIGDRVRIVRL